MDAMANSAAHRKALERFIAPSLEGKENGERAKTAGR
jgi:hypothetical protein